MPRADRFALNAIAMFTAAIAILIVLGIYYGGWALFMGWAAGCTLLAWRRRLWTWSIAVLLPLTIVSLNWVLSGYPAADPFGLALIHTQLFLGLALVTAATGNVLILRSRELQAQPVA